MQGGSLRQKFLHGAVWSLVGSVMSRGLGMASGIVAARVLGKVHYGELGMLQGTLELFGFVGGLGLGMIATKRVAELHQTDPAGAGRIIGFGLGLSVVSGLGVAALAFAFAGPLATQFLSNSDLAATLRICCVLVASSILQGVVNGVLSGFHAFREASVVLAVSGVLRLIVTLIGASFGNVEAIVWGWVAAEPVVVILNLLCLRNVCRRFGVRLSFAVNSDAARAFLTIGFPWVLSSATVVPLNWAIRALLAGSPGGYAQLGVFTAANQWYNIVLYVPMVLGNVALPMATTIHASGDPVAFRRFAFRMTLLRAGLGLMVALPIAGASPWLVRLYGSQYSEGSIVIAILAIAALLETTFTSFGLTIIAAGRLWALFYVGLFKAAVCLTVGAILIGKGSTGMAAAMCLSSFAGLVVTTIYSRTVLFAGKAELK